MPKKSKSVSLKSPSATSKSEKLWAISIPTPSLKATLRDEKPALEEAPISPRIHALSKNFNESDVTTYEEGATPSQWAFIKIPPQLLPFVRNPTLGNLQRTLARCGFDDWRYYAHPIVQEQIRYLVDLRFNSTEWNRLGWECEYDPITDTAELVDEYQNRIAKGLESLIEAHVNSFWPFCRIQFNHYKGKWHSGYYNNPYPCRGVNVIPHWALYNNITYLREAIVNHSDLTKKLANLPVKPDIKKINDLKKVITWVLNEAGPDWSGLQKDIPEPDQSTKPSSPKSAKPKDFLFHPDWPQCYSWDLPQFDEILRTFKTTSQSTLGKDGRPACLTYLIFGQLLDKKPSQIQNVVITFRRSPFPARNR